MTDAENSSARAAREAPAAPPALPDTAETVVYESDWLGSVPCFYDLRSGRAGHDINAVIDPAEVEFDPEGLNDYLDFGYSVFERTPVRGVRVLRHSSRLLRGPHGLRVEQLADPTLDWFERESTVDEVLEAAGAVVNAAAATSRGDVVVPTSGGYDSRFIDLLIADRSRVRAFTYGTADRPELSPDVVKGAELARRLGLDWRQVAIGDFHRLFDEWDALFGPTVHAHGMYQLEFYRALAPLVAPGSLVLSGAFGDSLAGVDDGMVMKVPVLDDPDDLPTVFRYGAMCGDSSQSVFPRRREGWRRLLDEDPRLRTEMLPRVVAMLRQQTTFFSYMYRLPAAVGLESRAPFVDAGLARPMLALPPALRHERAWQRELFAARGLDLEHAGLAFDWRNTLNLRALRRVPLEPLDPVLLREVVKPDYVRWANRHAGRYGLPWELFVRLGWRHGFRRLAKALRAAGVEDQRLPAYFAYLTLRPLQQLIERRDRARRGEAAP
jgi:asparagine synthetase B (glutamine-hydrolysing)